MIDLVTELKSVVAAEYQTAIDDIVKTEGITTNAD